MKGLTSFRKGLKMADQRLLAWHPRRRAKTTNSEKTTNKISLLKIAQRFSVTPYGGIFQLYTLTLLQ